MWRPWVQAPVLQKQTKNPHLDLHLWFLFLINWLQNWAHFCSHLNIDFSLCLFLRATGKNRAMILPPGPFLVTGVCKTDNYYFCPSGDLAGCSSIFYLRLFSHHSFIFLKSSLPTLNFCLCLIWLEIVQIVKNAWLINSLGFLALITKRSLVIKILAFQEIYQSDDFPFCNTLLK
jgi:hypothetical protein